MATLEDQVQELAANQPMILYRLDQADEHRDKIDEKLVVLPHLTAEQVTTHDRMVALEKAVKKQADHQGGTKKRQVAAVAGAGTAGLGLAKIDVFFEVLGKMFGAG